MASFSQYGMILEQVWLDLHASDYENNVMTEYEEKFSQKGQVIYRVEATILRDQMFPLRNIAVCSQLSNITEHLFSLYGEVA